MFHDVKLNIQKMIVQTEPCPFFSVSRMNIKKIHCDCPQKPHFTQIELSLRCMHFQKGWHLVHTIYKSLNNLFNIK